MFSANDARQEGRNFTKKHILPRIERGIQRKSLKQYNSYDYYIASEYKVRLIDDIIDGLEEKGYEVSVYSNGFYVLLHITW